METCSYCQSAFPKEQGVPGGGRFRKGKKIKYFCDQDCLDLWKRETRESTAPDSEMPPSIYYSSKEPTRADRTYHGRGYDGGALGVRAPNDRPEKDWNPHMRILKTKAVDNAGYQYHVSLERSTTYFPGEWVLKIGHTPGQWMMSTLLERGLRHNEIYIDAGQGWKVVNFNDVLREAMTMV